MNPVTRYMNKVPLVNPTLIQTPHRVPIPALNTPPLTLCDRELSVSDSEVDLRGRRGSVLVSRHHPHHVGGRGGGAGSGQVRGSTRRHWHWSTGPSRSGEVECNAIVPDSSLMIVVSGSQRDISTS